MIISVPVNPGCSCLLSLGGLYIDSAYYQPQTIATPIIIHLGPQDLFWPRRCTESSLSNSLDLLLNPSPLLNSVSASQLQRRRSPWLLHPHQTQQQYWKQYGGESTSGSTLSRPGRVLVKRRPQPRLFFFDSSQSENINKTQSNTFSAFGNLNVFQSNSTGVWNSFSVKLQDSNRPSAPAHSQYCDRLYVNTIFNICIYGCMWVLNIYI